MALYNTDSTYLFGGPYIFMCEQTISTMRICSTPILNALQCTRTSIVSTAARTPHAAHLR